MLEVDHAATRIRDSIVRETWGLSSDAASTNEVKETADKDSRNPSRCLVKQTNGK